MNELIITNSKVPESTTTLIKRDYINHMVSSSPREGVLFADFINAFLQHKMKRASDTYIRQ